MTNLQKFKYIKNIKISKKEEFKTKNIRYCTKILNELIKTKTVYNIFSINKVANNVCGVYLIYSVDQNKQIKFSYIGESVDILSRWKKHIYNFKNSKKEANKFKKKEQDLNNFRFIILEEILDLNTRLKAETYYIFVLRSWFTNTNIKIANKKMRCDFGHGVRRVFLSYKNLLNEIELYIYGVCRNKDCKNKFLIESH